MVSSWGQGSLKMLSKQEREKALALASEAAKVLHTQLVRPKAVGAASTVYFCYSPGAFGQVSFPLCTVRGGT
eukprot:38327-Eustigmatos_ZCMA.PRE.1